MTDKPHSPSPIGVTVKEFREKHNLTQPQLALALGMPRFNTVHDWECGRTTPPPYLPLALEQLSMLISVKKGYLTKIKLNAR